MSFICAGSGVTASSAAPLVNAPCTAIQTTLQTALQPVRPRSWPTTRMVYQHTCSNPIQRGCSSHGRPQAYTRTLPAIGPSTPRRSSPRESCSFTQFERVWPVVGAVLQAPNGKRVDAALREDISRSVDICRLDSQVLIERQRAPRYHPTYLGVTRPFFSEIPTLDVTFAWIVFGYAILEHLHVNSAASIKYSRDQLNA